MFAIYCHANKKNGKRYIGMTNNVKRRWRQEGSEYKSATKFYEAIQKYGWNSFTHEILESGLSESEAREAEKKYIALYNTTDAEYGYNTDKGGHGGRIYKEHPRNMAGKHQSLHQREKQTALMLREDFNPMKNGTVIWGKTHKHPRGMAGKHHTESERKHVSDVMKRKHVNCKPVRIIYPDGKIKIFHSVTEAQSIGLTKPVILKIIRSDKPYKIACVNQHTDKIAHLNGIRISFLDNTEVTA